MSNIRSTTCSNDEQSDEENDKYLYEPMSKLLSIVFSGSLTRLTQHLKKHIGTINVRQIQPPNLTLFHACVRLRELKILKHLVDFDKEILLDSCIPTECGRTPIHSACENDDCNMIKYLLTLNNVVQSINATDNEGIAPILIAAKHGNIQIIKHLCGKKNKEGEWNYNLKDRALVHIPWDRSGQTPMLVAVAAGNLNLIKLLVKVDRVQNVEKMNLITSSSSKSIANGSIICANSRDGWTPFLLACVGNHLNIIRWLYNNGGNRDIDKPNKQGVTPMKYSVAAGTSHEKIVRQLQRYGVPLVDSTTARLGFFKKFKKGKEL